MAKSGIANCTEYISGNKSPSGFLKAGYMPSVLVKRHQSIKAP